MTIYDYCVSQGDETLLREWDTDANGALTPQTVSIGSHRKVCWRCEKGHRWIALPCRRTYSGSGCPYCSGLLAIPGETDLATLCPEIAREWDFEKNGDLTPRQVQPRSKAYAWWVCPQGHSYRTSIRSRGGGGTGCPYCSGHAVLPGFNDLATRFPKLARQWHPTLNGALTPQQVTCGCNKKIWWVCGEQHVWSARVDSRTGRDKCGCPVCAGRVKREKRADYDAAAQVHPRPRPNAEQQADRLSL